MVEANTQNSDERLYLDDVFLRERFTSRTHVIDEAEIKAFAQQQTPSVPLRFEVFSGSHQKRR